MPDLTNEQVSGLVARVCSALGSSQDERRGRAALQELQRRLDRAETERDAKTEDFFKFFEAAAVEFRRAETAEALVGELRGALERLADLHHRTLTNSRLHDPERIDSFHDCPCKTCHDASAALAKTERDGERGRA